MLKQPNQTQTQVPDGALCANHVQRTAVFTCTRCGDFGCGECLREGNLCSACSSRSGVVRAPSFSPEAAELIRAKMRGYNRRSLWFGIPGVLSGGLTPYRGIPALLRATDANQAAEALGMLFAGLISLALIVTGAAYYARVKNRTAIHGMWMLLGALGILVIGLMQKRCHHCDKPGSFRSKVCGACGAPMSLSRAAR